MHGKDFLINDSRDGKAVEAVCEGLPQLDVIPPLALIVETVDTVDRSALVVPPKNEEILRILDLVRKKKADRLE